LNDCALAAETEDGADVIILGCSGFRNMAKRMEEALADKGYAVPVLDAVPITVLHAVTAVRLGHCHSKKTYDSPPSKEITGYNMPRLNRDM
jgi:allantoin racemase